MVNENGNTQTVRAEKKHKFNLIFLIYGFYSITNKAFWTLNLNCKQNKILNVILSYKYIYVCKKLYKIFLGFNK